MTIFVSERIKKSSAYRMARAVYYAVRAEFPSHLPAGRGKSDSRKIASYLADAAIAKLQIGAGTHDLKGWLNTDFFPESREQIHLDATEPFPFPDASFDLIFSEHVIEHVPLQGGINMIDEAFRILKPGGRLRISTPPLEFLLKAYSNSKDALNKRYLDWHFESYNPESLSKSPVVLFNDYMRMWGHVFIYDEILLKDLFRRSGFVDVRNFEINKSDDPRLIGLENDGRMPDGLLQLSTMTVEGLKPA